jgi:hypothetical protein
LWVGTSVSDKNSASILRTEVRSSFPSATTMQKEAVHFLWNSGTHLSHHRVSQFRWPQYKTSSPWKSEISRSLWSWNKNQVIQVFQQNRFYMKELKKSPPPIKEMFKMIAIKGEKFCTVATCNKPSSPANGKDTTCRCSYCFPL